MKKSFEQLENFYQESLFTFNSNKCFCAIDTINISPGEIKKIFKVNSLKSELIKFAFQPKDGLVRLSLQNGAVEEANILSSLLSIKYDNIENYRRFFEKNGFLYTLNGDGFVQLDDQSLLLIINRMRVTVELMSQISEVQRKDYDRILTLTLALLLTPETTIQIGDYLYKTCKHEKLNHELLISSNIKEDTFNLRCDENFDFTIKDTIYKGDALLQKQYTVDYLSKKRKVNEGEVPQYYVEGSHEEIVSPEVFDLVQYEYERRKKYGKNYSSNGIFSTRIFCGQCGGMYGAKVWHSNNKYRTIMYRCNNKYGEKKRKGKECSTPALREAEIKEAFLGAFNSCITNRAEIIKNCRVAIDTVIDTTKLEIDVARLTEECAVVTEIIRKCVDENAHVSVDPQIYAEKYESLASR